MSMKTQANMPERMRAHIRWLDGLSKVRRLLHWLQSGSCAECQWRRAGRRTLQRVLSGQNDAATMGTRTVSTRLAVRQENSRGQPIQDTSIEHSRGLEIPKWLR